MLKHKDSGGLVFKWLSNKNTIEFLGVWEKIYNSNFNYTEFGIIMSEAGKQVYEVHKTVDCMN
jgi:hypothetical protein